MNNVTRCHHYCIMRDDLPVGDSHAQLLHAAGESNPTGEKCYAVVLSVCHDDLIDIQRRLSESLIKHVSIYETDSPYLGELTAIGINPLIKKENKSLRRIVSGIKLLR